MVGVVLNVARFYNGDKNNLDLLTEYDSMRIKKEKELDEVHSHIEHSFPDERYKLNKKMEKDLETVKINKYFNKTR